ncbi:MAG: type IV secretion system protein [Sulfurimonas sp.]|jgi:type IV secretion system protein VirB8|uniref:virB8 family protein n=1 Tax=Sulfurimonas sp. TaxID=2022749 RepID=UPI003569587C
MIFNKNQALDFESSKKDLLEKSEKKAWLVAIASTIVTVLLTIAIFLLLPLKTTEPYVVKVDSTTGLVDIITIIDEKSIPASEALDKYFVKQYVAKREGYFYDVLANDYLAVQLMSNDKVAAEYRKIYEGDNGRAEQYKNQREIDVKVLSVVLGESAGTKTATIRAILTDKDLYTNTTSQQKTIVGTLSYEYKPQTKLSEEERLINPLGFTVKTYRLDNEVQ